MSEAKKQYMGFWSSDTFKTAIDGVDDRREVFIEELDGLGYEAEEIEEIASMEVGDVWVAEHYGDSHTITRIA